jgi:hypothetical protein
VVQNVTDGDPLTSLPVTLGKPSKICVPVNIGGTDPTAPTAPDGLVCYKAKAPVKPLRLSLTENVLEPDGTLTRLPNTATVTVLREYCVPSKYPMSEQGWI